MDHIVEQRVDPVQEGIVKYVCIDSNIYRGLFAQSKDFKDEVRKLLLKLIDNDKVRLLLPLQVRQEVERDRYGEWCHNDVARLERDAATGARDISEFKQKYSSYEESKTLLEALNQEQECIEQEKQRTENRYRNNNSEENGILRQIFSKAVEIPETAAMIDAARLRTEKRNPPRDSDGHMGDCIIWECLLAYFKSHCMQGDTLILISNDDKAWGDGKLSLWLAQEWSDTTTCAISLVHSIADVGELTKDEQAAMREKEQEELKRNLIADFAGSGSFVAAGDNANRLLSIKESLTKGDLEQVLSACLRNWQIKQSYFTSMPLTTLLRDEGNTAIEITDDIDDKLWSAFCTTYGIVLSRPKDFPFR